MSYGDECPRDRDINNLERNVENLEYELRQTKESVIELERRFKAAIQELNELIGELGALIDRGA